MSGPGTGEANQSTAQIAIYPRRSSQDLNFFPLQHVTECDVKDEMGVRVLKNFEPQASTGFDEGGSQQSLTTSLPRVVT